ncbi:conserved hypothetical protein [Trichinella spiralis]|uniref:hypothetical protein n=1 Tax=Trichinella spiralis TaxID=6334 RepID=UPI0001EFBF40|nr:conserved hypothetical protein [Trichinella spiralis]
MHYLNKSEYLNNSTTHKRNYTTNSTAVTDEQVDERTQIHRENCIQLKLVKCTWNWQEFPCTYPKCRFKLLFGPPELPAALQFGLSLSDLRYFCKNMTEFSPDLRHLPYE